MLVLFFIFHDVWNQATEKTNIVKANDFFYMNKED